MPYKQIEIKDWKDFTQEHGKLVVSGNDCMEASDGYHTFTELYDHRVTLFIALCHALTFSPRCIFTSWRSKKNGDGSVWDGWFILGIGKKEGEQITYHLPLSRWEETDFTETLDQAPPFDGHTSEDVLSRLKNL
jgi:hypothetical protein